MLALPVATADTGPIIGAARCALAAVWRPGFRYKKARVMLLEAIIRRFPAIERATGLRLPLPQRLKDLMKHEERPRQGADGLLLPPQHFRLTQHHLPVSAGEVVAPMPKFSECPRSG